MPKPKLTFDLPTLPKTKNWVETQSHWWKKAEQMRWLPLLQEAKRNANGYEFGKKVKRKLTITVWT